MINSDSTYITLIDCKDVENQHRVVIGFSKFGVLPNLVHGSSSPRLTSQVKMKIQKSPLFNGCHHCVFIKKLQCPRSHIMKIGKVAVR